MKLIGTTTSPFVRKTRIVLAEKKIDYEFVIDSPWNAGSGVPDLNPLGKIPVLVLDDESALFDSRVIVEYIDSTTPNNKLIPSPNRQKIEVKLREALADGICEAAALAFLEGKRPAAERSATWTARQRDKIVRGLAFMAAELGEHAWSIGTHFSLADIATGATLGYLDFRFADIDWRHEHPNLARLAEKLALRPSFADTVPHD